MGRVVVVAITASAVCLGLVALSQAAPTYKIGCGSADGTTLIEEDGARVYTLPDPESHRNAHVFACLKATGKSRQLDASTKGCLLRSCRDISVDTRTLALKAPWVAYPEYANGVDTYLLELTAKNLRTGKTSYCPVGGGIAPAPPPLLFGIALKANGHDAWIGKSRIEPSNGRSDLVHAVGTCDSAEASVLESGEGIELHSLELNGSTLTWMDSGEARTAQLR